MNLYVKNILDLIDSISLVFLVSPQTYAQKMNPNGIFANNELDLRKIKVYGFDFGLLIYPR